MNPPPNTTNRPDNKTNDSNNETTSNDKHDEDVDNDHDDYDDEEEKKKEQQDVIKKSCQCVLCGQTFIASTQEDCVAHMEVCQAFDRVHPTDGSPVNPNGVYDPPPPPPSAAAAAAAAATAASPPPPPPPPTRTTTPVVLTTPIEEMSIKELQQTIINAGFDYKDCIEKQDLQQRARQAYQESQ